MTTPVPDQDGKGEALLVAAREFIKPLADLKIKMQDGKCMSLAEAREVAELMEVAEMTCRTLRGQANRHARADQMKSEGGRKGAAISNGALRG